MIVAKEIEWRRDGYGYIGEHLIAETREVNKTHFVAYVHHPYNFNSGRFNSLAAAKQFCQDQLNAFVNSIAKEI